MKEYIFYHMMAQFCIAPLQMLHAFYKYSRDNRPADSYKDILTYRNTIYLWFAFAFLSPFLATRTELGQATWHLLLIIIPTIINTYYFYICFKKHPKLTTNKNSHA